MANICDNRFYFSAEDNYDKWHDRLLACLGEIDEDYNIEECGESCAEGYFTSRWSFPLEKFEQYFDKECEKDGVYFRCLSEEYGCGYVAMNIFQDGEFREEQTFDI